MSDYEDDSYDSSSESASADEMPHYDTYMAKPYVERQAQAPGMNRRHHDPRAGGAAAGG